MYEGTAPLRPLPHERQLLRVCDEEDDVRRDVSWVGGRKEGGGEGRHSEAKRHAT